MNLTVLNFKELATFRVYELENEKYFDTRDLRDWFGLRDNNQLIRNVSEENKRHLNFIEGVQNQIKDINPKGLTLVTKKGLIEISLKQTPRCHERKKLIEEFRKWAINVLEEVMDFGVHVADGISKQEVLNYLDFKACIALLQQDELTVNKFKKNIKELLPKVPYKKRNSMIKRLVAELKTIETDDVAFSHQLKTLTNELLEFKIERDEQSKKLLLSRRENKIKKLEDKVAKLEWVPDLVLDLKYVGFTKNHMYEVKDNKMVKTDYFKNWKNFFPKEKFKDLPETFKTQELEWKLGGTFYEKWDPSNLITPLQDQIAEAIGRDDKEIIFQGFLEDIEKVAKWQASNMVVALKIKND